MLNIRQLNYLLRVLFVSSKVITEYMDECKPYSFVKKVITISIVYFNFGQGKGYLYEGETKFIRMNENDKFELSEEQKAMFNKKNASGIFPYHYLIRVNQFDDNAKNTLDEWIYFFKNSVIKDEFTAKGLIEAREKLKTINITPRELYAYNRYLDRLSSDDSISQTLKYEVEYKKTIEIAKEFLKNGADINIVAKSPNYITS